MLDSALVVYFVWAAWAFRHEHTDTASALVLLGALLVWLLLEGSRSDEWSDK